MSTFRDLTITTSDGFDLAVRAIEPESSPKAVIQFHAGTVVPKEFYLKYASYLADQGSVVVLFDYRGVGGSRPKKLSGFKAGISDWGIYDAPAVLSWIRATYKHLPVHLLAHSMGGQILGLMHNWSAFDNITVVASSSGNWHNFEDAYRRKISISSKLTFPIFLTSLGYVPGRFGLGYDWPKQVAIEWLQCSKKDMLMAEYLDERLEETFYRKIDKKITAYFLEDDLMATAKTIPNYQKSYPNAQVTIRILKSMDYGLERIGHFGLFKEWSKGRLWEDVMLSLLN